MSVLKIRQFPWWLAILLIIASSLLFLTLYALAQSLLPLLSNQILKIATGFLLGCTITGLYLLFIYLVEGVWTSSVLSTRHFPLDIGKGILVGIIFFAIITGILALGGWYSIKSIAFHPSFWDQLSLFFLVACGEEIVFRGIIFRFIDLRWNTGYALIISALLFGALHIFNDSATVWSSLAIAIEAGLMLGMIYKVSGSLWAPIGVHWAWNVMEGPVLGFAVSGTTDTSIITPIITGPDFITGGSFGAEASIFSAAIGLVFTILLWRYRK